jgi:uncharacterized protein
MLDGGLARFVATQPWMMRCLSVVAAQGPPGGWIGAGFLRNAVWDVLSGRATDAIPPADIDVVFHDAADVSAARDAAIEAALRVASPGLPWSVANQARMHGRNGHAPYRDLADALSHWPETATAVAARIGDGMVEVLAPYGEDDLFALVARPTPGAHAAMQTRLDAKGWRARWPDLRIILP